MEVSVCLGSTATSPDHVFHRAIVCKSLNQSQSPHFHPRTNLQRSFFSRSISKHGQMICLFTIQQCRRMAIIAVRQVCLS